MLMTLPIKFDNDILLQFQDGKTLVTRCYPTNNTNMPCTFNKVSGYDLHGNRVTNLVGFDGKDFLKECSREECKCIMRASDFGQWGRTMENGQHRDQSNCPDCRSQY